MDHLAIAIAQLDPTVGDIAHNLAKLRAAHAEAARQGADLVVATELGVSGYQPEDLVLKPAFVAACEAAVHELAEVTHAGPGLIVGSPWVENGKVYNAAVLLEGGRVAGLRFKHELPNYGVFDEKRVFAAGPAPGPMVFRGVRLGVMVCEDMWFPDVSETLQESGAELLIVINGSPFETEKRDERLSLAVTRIKETGLPLLYVNQVCGQDEVVYDGASFALDADCRLKAQAPDWRESVLTTRWRREDARWTIDQGPTTAPSEGLEAIYQALVLGLRDYVEKNRFPGVVLGLSGGIDSALTAAIAVDALGPERVHAVMMPSPYTSPESLEDAETVATLLGIDYRSIDIEPAMGAFAAMLQDSFADRQADITEENIQSRARGMTLMALSNKFGWMVVSTGNKSEMSVGYATLYGDMCGGYAIPEGRLQDDGVRALAAAQRGAARWAPRARGPRHARARHRQAALRRAQAQPDATRTDLPPYAMLDDILECLVEHEMPPWRRS